MNARAERFAVRPVGRGTVWPQPCTVSRAGAHEPVWRTSDTADLNAYAADPELRDVGVTVSLAQCGVCGTALLIVYPSQTETTDSRAVVLEVTGAEGPRQ